ncbi:hypothetical protein F5Y18DRAFT_425100 [Xylariaceae sp. FL1019]|nr:hypothetical protein F5Y18DRAFT_425100 [Xylariaceae sp. FL1019]
MALRESYEREEITEVRWINSDNNPADAMTKTTPNKALERLVDNNKIVIRVEGSVERKKSTTGPPTSTIRPERSPMVSRSTIKMGEGTFNIQYALPCYCRIFEKINITADRPRVDPVLIDKIDSHW